MILQQFPYSPVIKKILETYFSNLGEESPVDGCTRAYFPLPTDCTKGMVFDLVRNSSLLFDKVNIAEVIDFAVDITDFKTKSGQLRTVAETDNEIFAKYTTPLEAVSNDIMTTSPYNVTVTAIEKFVVFAKLVGMTELSLDNVYLSEGEGEMTITMSDNHPIFTGSLRIKTW